MHLGLFWGGGSSVENWSGKIRMITSTFDAVSFSSMTCFRIVSSFSSASLMVILYKNKWK